MGLMKAVEKFRSGAWLTLSSTYATRWIRQAVQRVVAATGHTIRVPVHMGKRIRKSTRAYDELSERLPPCLSRGGRADAETRSPGPSRPRPSPAEASRGARKGGRRG
jgi:hypothetical protein